MLLHLIRSAGVRGRVGGITFTRKIGTVGVGADIPSHNLSDIMKTELLEEAPAEQVSQIWTDYHKNKEEFISAVIPSMHYAEITAKARICPRFVYALPKDNGGFDMIYSEINGHRVSFTSLEAFKTLQSSAPPLLELFHYVDFQQSKGVVLMRGVHKLPLTSTEAVFLANQLQMYYRIDPERYKLVHTFNHNPMFFDFNELLRNLDNPDLIKRKDPSSVPSPSGGSSGAPADTAS